MNAIEQFKSQYSVTIAQDIIWGDMDAFNHINNTVYFRYFENARIEYFERTNINALMQKTKIGPILGETECKYLAPLTYPDKITVGAKVTEIKEKRFSQHYEVFSHKMNKVVAKGRGEIVYFNYADAQTCRIPDEILAAIDRLENQVAGER